MYRVVKIFFWAIAFVYLLNYYKWVMPSAWTNFLASLFFVAAFILISETVIHFWAIPRFFRRARYGSFLAIVVLSVAATGAVSLLAAWFLIQPATPSSIHYMTNKWHDLIFSNLFIAAALAATSVATKLTFDWFAVQKRLDELETEKTKAELGFLKSQLNPHFLFNSLNTIYGAIDKENKDARQSLLQFSEMLRYQLYDCETDFVPLEKEAEHLSNYVELQKRRRNGNTDIRLELTGNLRGAQVAPLLFVPFVENAFKHLGNRPNETNCIAVELTGDSDSVHFRCFNTVDRLPSGELSKTSGIGIQNVERRLKLIYPEKHRLNIEKNVNGFRVDLTIDL